MSLIAPSLPPHLVQLGFDYILAVETGDDVQAARLAPEVEQLPGLLPGIAELIVFPVTALSEDTAPCADSFVLDEVGVIYLMAIRAWATHAPAAAGPGIARTIAHFVGQVRADAPKDVAQALQALRRAVVDTVVALHRQPHHRTRVGAHLVRPTAREWRWTRPRCCSDQSTSSRPGHFFTYST